MLTTRRALLAPALTWAAANKVLAAPKAPPAFHAVTLNGERLSNVSLKGKVVLVQFWTTWCQFCRADQPVLDRLHHAYSQRGLVVLAVSMQEPRAKVQQYLARSPRACRVILSEATNLPTVFDAQAFPLYVALNRQGRSVARQQGSEGEMGLLQLLGEAGLDF